MIEIDKKGIEFLNRLYKDMYKSDAVMHGIDKRFIGNKTDNIGRYIERMRELHERVASSGRESDLQMLKSFYYQKYVIKEEDIPESYYVHQKEIYLERGYGHVEITKRDRHRMAIEIINNQKKRLDVWIEYLISKDSSYIPMWAKYWAFQGMLSLGNYDKKNKLFGKRSNGTIAPFVDLNREALALSIDFLLKFLNREEVSDKKLEELVQIGSFGKIYSYILNDVLIRNDKPKINTQGKWVKYNQGSDHMPLVRSLQGYNTGWCTAGEATAKTQLSDGDFYVYYTYNEDGEAVVPRIAIRMEGQQIGEVRGIAKDQNIESDMEEIVEEKLNEFPDKEKYKKKVSDMKMLTLIYKKFNNNEELTIEQLRFLYQIDDKIKSFGYVKDPRIDEIISKRNMIDDLNVIFKNVDEHNGDLDLSCLTSAEGLKLPEVIEGELDLSNLTSARGLKLPKRVNGGLFLNSLTSAEGLELPEVINYYLDLKNLKSANGLNFPKTVNGDLLLSSLIDVNGLKLPETINGILDLSSLMSAEGLELPEFINGDLYLTSLTSIKGLKLSKRINGGLLLNSLTSAEGLELPEFINGDLVLSNLISARGLKFPKRMNGSLSLKNLTTIEGLELPIVINNGYLYLESLTNAEGLKLPEIIDGVICLDGLTNLNGVILPQKFMLIMLANYVFANPENVHEYVSDSKSK